MQLPVPGSPRPYFIGCGVRSDDPETFRALAEMVHKGMIDHIQVLVVPEPEHVFRMRVETLAGFQVPIILHAPHHHHGVNPCSPGVFSPDDHFSAMSVIESAFRQTLEMADELKTGIIVIHAGRYEEGRKNEAYAGFTEFLDSWFDPRFVLENLPAVYQDMQFIGLTADDLTTLAGGRIKEFCLDFAHLYCTANYCGFSFRDELSRFTGLPVSLHHLSNCRRSSYRDEHLPLDHPDGGLDFGLVMRWISAHPGIQTSLEYKYRDSGLYLEQVRVFDALYRKFI